MIKKILFLISLPVITLAVLCCDGGGNGGEEDKTPAPYIESILTDYEGKAVAGKPVTLTGINFSPVAADNKVVYGVGLDAVSILVDEATEERVVFTAPEVSATKLNIRVSTKGKESNQVSLEFTTLPDPVEPEEPWSDVPTLDFAKLGGTTKTIVDGVEWTTFHGTWEGQIRNINIVRTTLNGHNHLGMYFSYYDTTYPAGFPECADGEDPRDLDKKCIYMNAIVGTNGPMACCHFARINGEIRRAAVETDNYFSSNCAMTIDGDKVDIVKAYQCLRWKHRPSGKHVDRRMRRTPSGLGRQDSGICGRQFCRIPEDHPSPYRFWYFQGWQDDSSGGRGRTLDPEFLDGKGYWYVHSSAFQDDEGPRML